MKKIVLAIAAMVLVAMGSIVNAADYNTEKGLTLKMVQSSNSVTVMWIRNNGSLWIKIKKTGVYDSKGNTITIGGSTYKVKDNPYYGDDDSHGRGAYRYVAGEQYYFNL